MSYEVNRTNCFFNTAQRQSGTESDFVMALYKPITLSKPTNYFKIKFNTVSIPYSWKQMDEFPWVADNTFSWNGGASHNFTIRMPEGNWNINEYLQQFKTQLSTALNSLEPTNDLLYNFTYNQPQGWITLQITSLSTTGFTLTLNNTQHTSQSITPQGLYVPFLLQTIFGFAKGVNVVWNGGGSNTSNNQINCAPINALFIRSNNLRVTAYESLVEETSPSDILCKIDITTQPYTITNWYNNIDLETRIQTQVIDNFGFYVTPINSYAPIHLHGCDFYFGLSVLEYNDPVAEALVSKFNTPVESDRSLGSGNRFVLPDQLPTGLKETQMNVPDVTDGGSAQDISPEENEKLRKELENLKSALKELDQAHGDAETLEEQ